MQTLPLLGAADSETDMVVIPWRVLAHHLQQDVTPGFLLLMGTHIYWSYICSTKSRLWRLLIMSSVVHAELVLLHHSSQLLFMPTPFNQLWSVVIITNNSTNFLKQEWSVHIHELWLQQWDLLLFCSLYCFFFFYLSKPEHCQWCTSKAAVKIHMGIIERVLTRI